MGRFRAQFRHRGRIVLIISLPKAEKSEIERMGDEMQVKRIMNATREGRIPVRRPRKNWKDVLARDLDAS